MAGDLRASPRVAVGHAVRQQCVKDARVRGVPAALPNVRAVLTQETEKLRASVKLMVASGDFDIATRAAKFLADNTEIQNIKSTIETQTARMTKPMREDIGVAARVGRGTVH
jgi:hypothetical protein